MTLGSKSSYTGAESTKIPGIMVTDVKFNHDSSSHSSDGLNIRNNYGSNILIPEWNKERVLPSDMSTPSKPKNFPAAYSIKDIEGKKVTVLARFEANDPQCSSAKIRASDGGILGSIDEFTVSFSNKVSSPEYISIDLKNQKISQNGVCKENITWNFEYSVDSGKTWRVANKVSNIIYVVLEEPKAPWKQSGFPSNNQLPWADVLDYACDWAKGSTSLDEAAEKITKKVNGAIKLKYDIVRGASKYTDGATNEFLCSDFINYLKGKGGNGNIVNCTDCATIVTSFANILGCDLTASVMGFHFMCNYVISIGFSNWAVPFNSGFSYHEVAWKDPCDYEDNLFDACLKVDGSLDPWTNSSSGRVPLLPVNMKFANKDYVLQTSDLTYYRERLCSNDTDGILKCLPQGPWSGTNNGRRKVK